jgi:hypothetical protein
MVYLMHQCQCNGSVGKESTHESLKDPKHQRRDMISKGVGEIMIYLMHRCLCNRNLSEESANPGRPEAISNASVPLPNRGGHARNPGRFNALAPRHRQRQQTILTDRHQCIA